MSEDLTNCFEFIPQQFLICITIHKARNLCIFNADTYVKVTFDQKVKYTKVFQNSESPYFNEYFVFEEVSSLVEILRKTIIFQVFKHNVFRKDINLGELYIDLATIWHQTGHLIFKKWAKLEIPIGSAETGAKNRGYLQIDISILSKYQESPAAIFEGHDYDDIEQNLLRANDESSIVNNVRYYITVYWGVFMKKADYIVQVSLAGFSGKTKVAKGCTHPEWNEQFSFSWILPSLCCAFLIQVFIDEVIQTKCICSYEVHLSDISFSGNVPTFGPSFLHVYDPVDSRKYLGRLLISIKTERLQKHLNPLRCMLSKTVSPLVESTYWHVENLVIIALIWAGDSIQLTSRGGTTKIGFSCGEYESNFIEIKLKQYENTSGKPTNLKYFTQKTPLKAMQLTGLFPDYRRKYQIDYCLTDLVEFLKTQINQYKILEKSYDKDASILTKWLKSTITKFQEKLKNANYLPNNLFTEWDKQRFESLQNYLDTVQTEFDNYLKLLKTVGRKFSSNMDRVYNGLAQTVKEMEMLIKRRTQDLWPDVILNISHSGIEFGHCRLNALDYMFSDKVDWMGRLCGKRHNLIFKYANCKHTCQNCGCIAAKIDGWLWIGEENEFREHCHPSQWTRKESLLFSPTITARFTAKFYLHQAKIRPGNEKIVGNCEAQVRIVLFEYCQESQTICNTLSPLWNQVITFKNLNLPGNIQAYRTNPIFALIQLFCLAPENSKNIPNFLGCTALQLNVRESDLNTLIDNSSRPSEAISGIHPPPLNWIPIVKDGVVRAEILISAELMETSPEKIDSNISIVTKTENLPAEISPVNRKFKIEVVFVGIRNLQTYHRLKGHAGKYRMKLTLGNVSLLSGPSGKRFGKVISFADCFANGYISLPEELHYWPPIILTLIQNLRNNEEANIAAAMLSNSSKYLNEPSTDYSANKTVTFEGIKFDSGSHSENHLQIETYTEKIPLLGKKQKPKYIQSKWHLVPSLVTKFKDIQLKKNATTYKNDDHEFSWWSKFYNSAGPDNVVKSFDLRKGQLVIYACELEKQDEFNFFQDWAESIPLIRGIKRRLNAPPIEQIYGNIKCKIEIAQCSSEDTKSISDDEKIIRRTRNAKIQKVSKFLQSVDVIVRVYIVQGLRLRSRDMYSESDPYVKVQYGSEVISDHANYIQNQSNPIFGKMFQLEGTIPNEHILHISIYDHDIMDDMIGCTTIDLEDRFRTKHRATLGIAKEYLDYGSNIWRDLKSPVQILKEIAEIHDLDPPEINLDSIKFGGKIFKNSVKANTNGENTENQLSLTVLRRLDEIPQIGYKLVPEHVETRSLYRADRPGIEQGKLQLWVEIYEKDNVPPPLDITPIPPNKYQLRVVIYNTSDVMLDESNVFGQKMSDIYLKGWLEDIDQAQYTDVHYRSLNGQGNFNWRMIFGLRYSPVDDMMVRTRRAAIYERFDTEVKVPPVFYLQIWDNDTFSQDDFLGVINLNLSHFPAPASSARKCTLKNPGKFVNLFQVRRVRGWFPAKGALNARDDEAVGGLAGKVEMQLQLVTEKEADARPAGLGRAPPEPLPAPHRPDTSFNWYSNPLHTLRHIILPQLTKCCLCLGLILIFGLVLFTLFYFSQ